jgi:allantoate deiminase
MESQVLNKLKWLANYGKDNQEGITRFVYTHEWHEAQQALKAWLEEEGFIVEIDCVGNLLASIKGESIPNEVVMTGSHLDSVVHGGIYDGQYGIIGGALSILRTIKKYGLPRRTLQLVSFAEEEGSRFPFAMWGSKNMFGKSGMEEIEGITDADGITMKEAMKRLGYSGIQQPKTDVRAFIEMHIEQGNVLEKEELDIGVVHSIVGQRRYRVTVLGESNHAGTTPMGYRRDAMKAASAMVMRVLEIADEGGDPLVATVGSFELKPNISNVVPGMAVFTLDVRHIDEAVLAHTTELMTTEIEKIAEHQNVKVQMEPWFESSPVAMDEEIIQILTESCKEKEVLYKLMHSGAAHDAQVVAISAPTSMIFVPSQSGISHSPLEFTSEQNLEKGIEVLSEALRKLAY